MEEVQTEEVQVSASISVPSSSRILTPPQQIDDLPRTEKPASVEQPMEDSNNLLLSITQQQRSETTNIHAEHVPLESPGDTSDFGEPIMLLQDEQSQNPPPAFDSAQSDGVENIVTP